MLAGTAASGGPARARSTASAFSAPVTRKTIRRAARSAGGVSVTPFGLERRGELVSPARRRAAGERDLLRGAGGVGEELGDAASGSLGVVDHLDLDPASPHGAPAASSRERSIEASCAPAKAGAPSRGGNHVSSPSPLLSREFAATWPVADSFRGNLPVPPSPLHSGDGALLTEHPPRARASAPSLPESR